MASGSEHTVPLLHRRHAEVFDRLPLLCLSRDTLFSTISHRPAENLTSWMSILLGQVQEEYTTDGSLDFDGKPALKHRTGGWRACRSVLGTEFCYCLAFSGISANLVTYLTGVLGQSNVAAARSVSTWQATCFFMPLAGAVVADSYWGRYRTMVVSCSVGVAGMIMTALSAYLPLLAKNGASFTSSNMVSAQEFVLFLGLYMIAGGLGGLRPCLMSFGADQFDDGDPSERVHKGSFFNWYLFNTNCAALISSTGIVWVQDHYGWALGLTIPVAVLAVGLFFLVAASRAYRFQPTRGSPLTRVCQVVVAAVRNFDVEQPDDSSVLYELPKDDGSMKGVQRIDHTTDLRFFDKAAIVTVSDKEAGAPAVCSPWRLCVVTQVEELKILARMLPVWATVVFFYAMSTQVSSTFVEQGMAMDAAVGSVRVPPASMSTFEVLTVIVLLPLYDWAFVPAARRLTGREKGVSELQRIGAGLAMPVLAMAAAAIVETVRLREAPGKISELWQAPQYALVGVGGVLTTIGQFDFFYSQAPAAMKTVCTALGFLAVAAGRFSEDMIPTVGFNMRKVTKGNVTIKLWDLGGQPRFRSMWERYCRAVSAIVYVVDAADRENMAIAKSELHDLLSKPSLTGIPLLVIGNKTDKPEAFPKQSFTEVMGLKAMTDREVACFMISCKNSTNIDSVIDWLIKHSKKKN